MEDLVGLCPKKADDSFFRTLPETVSIYCVGGAVRDFLLGKSFSDKDFVLVGADLDYFKKKGLKTVGKNFPVFLHPKTNEELALARKERKCGVGYKGFVFFTGKEVSLKEDLGRRDFTINAMAVDECGNLHDPFGGRKDLSNKTIKHISPAFVEDPLRVIRLGRFLAQLTEFNVHKDTYELCKEIVKSKEILALSKERIWTEISKGFGGPKPINMINFLLDCGAWKEITGSSHFSTDLHLFLESVKTNKISLEWIVANIFQNEDLENVHCTFPKAVHTAINVLKRTKVCRKNYVDTHNMYNDKYGLILDIFETANLFRNPKNLADFLGVSFYKHPEQKKILTSCFEFLSQVSLKSVIDSNYKTIEIKSAIREYRIEKLQEFMLTKNFS
ncbi:MAG: hypothetical protein EVA26_02510 [Burkholderiaceae bacterium]|nr:MAG: hypothetical protein EVA26_02510 [Burkholderiaceae bacterium]